MSDAKETGKSQDEPNRLSTSEMQQYLKDLEASLQKILQTHQILYVETISQQRIHNVYWFASLMEQLDSCITNSIQHNRRDLFDALFVFLRSIIRSLDSLALDQDGSNGASTQLHIRSTLIPTCVMKGIIFHTQDVWDWKEKPHLYVSFLEQEYTKIYEKCTAPKASLAKLIVYGVRQMKQVGWKTNGWETPLTVILPTTFHFYCS